LEKNIDRLIQMTYELTQFGVSNIKLSS